MATLLLSPSKRVPVQLFTQDAKVFWLEAVNRGQKMLISGNLWIITRYEQMFPLQSGMKN